MTTTRLDQTRTFLYRDARLLETRLFAMQFEGASPDSVAAPTANADPRVLDIVREAVEQQTVLEITYDDRHDTRTRRHVEAQGLYTSDGTWALVA